MLAQGLLPASARFKCTVGSADDHFLIVYFHQLTRADLAAFAQLHFAINSDQTVYNQ